MKKIILLISLFLFIPFVISSNSIDISWKISEDQTIEEVDGFYLFFSTNQNYYIPKLQSQELCNQNANCRFIKRVSDTQITFSYSLSGLSNTLYHIWLYPSNPSSNLLGPQISFKRLVHFKIPPVKLPAELFWAVGENTPHQLIEGFFIFYSEDNIFKPSLYTSIEDCNEMDNCLFFERNNKSQINFTYDIDIISENENYISIYPLEQGMNSLGQPLFFITRDILIEEENEFVEFSELEIMYLTISKYYKELSEIQNRINQGDLSSKTVEEREILYTKLRNLGQENILDKEGMLLNWVQLWEMRSLQFYNYVFPDNERENMIKEKFSELIEIQKKINDGEILDEIFAEKYNLIVYLHNESVTPFPKLSEEYNGYYDFWIAVYNDDSNHYINQIEYFSNNVQKDNLYVEISILYEQIANLQSKINIDSKNNEYQIKRESIRLELERRGETDLYDKEGLTLSYDQIWEIKSQKYFPLDSTYIPVEKPINPIHEEKKELSNQKFDYDKIFNNKIQELIWPVNLDLIKLSSCYGWRRLNPVSKPNDFRWHDGIDIAVIKGTEVLAVADGVVEETCVDTRECGLSGCTPSKCSARGTYINLYHPALGTYSQYNHLSELKVEKGDIVYQGDVVGLSGNTGTSSGPHLDFKYYFDSSMISRLNLENERPSGNPLCYLPPLPQIEKYYSNLKNYFTPTAESCTFGRITTYSTGGDSLGAITKCPHLNLINYQPFLVEEKKVEENIEEPVVYEKNRDIEKVLKVMEFAKDNSINGRRCHCGDSCRIYLEKAKFYSQKEIDLLLFVSLIMQESSCTPTVFSGSSVGLMQINLEYWCKEFDFLSNDKDLCKEELLNDIDKNIRAGIGVIESNMNSINFDGCGFLKPDLNERYGIKSGEKILYTGWEAALRRYNGGLCARDSNYVPIPSLIDQDYFVPHIIYRFSQLKQLYDNSDNLHYFNAPICGTNFPGKNGQDLSNRECRQLDSNLDCWGYTVYTDYSSQACPGNQYCCLKQIIT